MTDIAATIAVLLILVSVWFQGLYIANRLRRFCGMERKLDLLLKHAGLDYDPVRDVPEDVVRALRDGQKIEAIKKYRALTGAGLAEAKEIIEEVQKRGKY